MAKTTVSCPQCQQPVAADITRLFDVAQDPQAKQILLSGAYNLIECPNCGYRGQVPEPIVYHDPSKELLLTFFPPSLNVPVNQQEQMIGPLINKVMESLPMEQRKAYLLKPETMLTRQRLVERILEEDGVTPEMLEAQQKRLNLLQRLAGTSPESRPDVIKQEEELVDEQLLMILQRLIQSAAASGEEQSANVLAELQQQLLENTEYGRKVLKQVQDQQTAMQALEDASKEGLTREKLLDMIVDAADNEVQLATLVAMARGGMDYGFFQLLAERIQQSDGELQAKLTKLREDLLEMTHEIDEAIKEQEAAAGQLLDKILEQDDVEAATMEALPAISEIFLEVLRKRIQAARKDDNESTLKKLQAVTGAIQKVSAPGANVELIEALIQAEDEAGMNQILDENADEVTDEFMQFLLNLMNQTSQQDANEATAEKLQQVYRQALRFSMKRNLDKESTEESA
ncbi:MAG: CpXC domain-containing protein [Chloroflexota bacterium]|nr:CpXC domain-containing protein [Chloroflexota bacterium]